MRSKKKELGQFFTDPVIAEFMVKLVLDDKTKTLLDPAVGMGVFTKIAHSRDGNLDITACEIDPEMIVNFRKENSYPFSLYEQDYLYCMFDKKFDAILCNPPYNKFQEIPNRSTIIKDFHSRYSVKLSGYSNLCVYFLVKSMNEMNENGKCCYIIPYEFLNTGYGKVIKKYLLESRMLKTIIKFSNNLSLFSEAITTSCIIVLENNNRSSVDFVNINNVDELDNLSFSNIKEYSYSELSPDEKWLQYFDDTEKLYDNTVPMETFGRVSRGIATGNNAFFTLNMSMIRDNNLSENVCLRCLTKSPDVKDIVFTDDSFEKLRDADKKVYLFDGERAKTESDYAYIQLGESREVNKAYLTSHRNPWYALEEKKPAPILMCVFSRNRIKIIRNEAGIKNLTTFHGLHLKNDNKEFADLMFCYLLTPLAQELLFLSRREYGDGLTKFEPNDLTRALVLDLRVIEEEDIKQILEIYEEIKKTNKEVRLDELDKLFRKYV